MQSLSDCAILLWVSSIDEVSNPSELIRFFGADDSFKQEPPTGRRKRWRLVLNESIRQGMEVSLRQMGKQRRLNYVYI